MSVTTDPLVQHARSVWPGDRGPSGRTLDSILAHGDLAGRGLEVHRIARDVVVTTTLSGAPVAFQGTVPPAVSLAGNSVSRSLALTTSMWRDRGVATPHGRALQASALPVALRFFRATDRGVELVDDRLGYGSGRRSVTVLEQDRLEAAMTERPTSPLFIREHLDGNRFGCVVHGDRVVGTTGSSALVDATVATLAAEALAALPAMNLGRIEVLVRPTGEVLALSADPAPVVSRLADASGIARHIIDEVLGSRAADHLVDQPFDAEFVGMSDAVGFAECLETAASESFAVDVSIAAVDPVHGSVRLAASAEPGHLAVLAAAATAGVLGRHHRCTAVSTRRAT
ncbi:hypothetical protein [Ilumatobacter nonamiensis]|uniref:hypothetical protein n=1 Tax=Ilumatobacter nonamiensis TaxID=467093 RepID=UPI00034A3AEC|nr:hypothetical protein [Ilumatobacter nonamiensis]